MANELRLCNSGPMEGDEVLLDTALREPWSLRGKDGRRYYYGQSLEASQWRELVYIAIDPEQRTI